MQIHCGIKMYSLNQLSNKSKQQLLAILLKEILGLEISVDRHSRLIEFFDMLITFSFIHKYILFLSILLEL
jgi:hypothetical protein